MSLDGLVSRREVLERALRLGAGALVADFLPSEAFAQTSTNYSNPQYTLTLQQVRTGKVSPQAYLDERFRLMPEVQEAILTGNQVYRLGYQISERLKEGRLRQNQFDIELDAQENAYASILGQDSLQDTTKENLSQIDSEIKKTNSAIKDSYY